LDVTSLGGHLFETPDLSKVAMTKESFEFGQAPGNLLGKATVGVAAASVAEAAVLAVVGSPEGQRRAVQAADKIGTDVARKITGYTKHGINQAISKDGVGVAPRAILDTVRNSTQVIPQSGGRTMHVGEQGTVILNESGKVITTWATTSQAHRGQ